ncbi:hypothetical protein CXG81DRAFT_20585 [Caulochytrium protostelioides]|uniref:NADH dehydrogenase [ubiquinone] 1 alpha subcomplex subunit 7 n=1 Tax=Caulochytrium protostelioides TaxID=1555241 RepID=A0A4P9X203_9FUNG|nr:hypothetical protein CXG81DRAFT_20585 [Caulochytrium protostelioides]|eukprot:RKO99312.1 hypothetical protein CXG81DRAFT_20585 [Caulochytrium protostelioides]
MSVQQKTPLLARLLGKELFEKARWLWQVNPTYENQRIGARDHRFPSPNNQPNFRAPKDHTVHDKHYYLRDTRRLYPQTSVYSNAEIRQQRLALTSGTPSPADTAPSATATQAHAEVNTAALPPRFDNRHRYRPANPTLAPSEVNAEFSIQGRV